MSYANQELSEGTETLYLHRNSRAEKNIMCGDVGVDAVVIVTAIMSVDVDHNANPGQELALERGIPSIQIRGVTRDDRSAVIGITEENISLGRNLCPGSAGRRCQ